MHEGQKLIYNAFMDGIFDSSDIHTCGREEDFSEKYKDDDDDDEWVPKDMPDLESKESAEKRRNQRG